MTPLERALALSIVKVAAERMIRASKWIAANEDRAPFAQNHE